MPGHEKMLSVTTKPAIIQGSWVAKTVTNGTSEVRRTCRARTAQGGRPFERAVLPDGGHSPGDHPEDQRQANAHAEQQHCSGQGPCDHVPDGLAGQKSGPPVALHVSPEPTEILDLQRLIQAQLMPNPSGIF